MIVHFDCINVSYLRPAKSHGFAVGPTVLKQISRSQGLEKSTVNSKMEKNENIYLSHLHLLFCRKKKCLFSARTTVVFFTLFRTEYNSIIKETIKNMFRSSRLFLFT